MHLQKHKITFGISPAKITALVSDKLIFPTGQSGKTKNET